MDLFDKYFNYSLKYLAYRPRSEKETRDALKRRKATDDIIEKVIDTLKDHKFINDDEFTRWWIEQRITHKPRSKRVLIMGLKLKGITQELITKYVFEENDTAVNDLEQALRLLSKKITRYQHLEKEKLYQKLGGALARKGFSWDVIKRAIDLALSQDR